MSLLLPAVRSTLYSGLRNSVYFRFHRMLRYWGEGKQSQGSNLSIFCINFHVVPPLQIIQLSSLQSFSLFLQKNVSIGSHIVNGLFGLVSVVKQWIRHGTGKWQCHLLWRRDLPEPCNGWSLTTELHNPKRRPHPAWSHRPLFPCTTTNRWPNISSFSPLIVNVNEVSRSSKQQPKFSNGADCQHRYQGWCELRRRAFYSSLMWRRTAWPVAPLVVCELA